MRLQLAVPEYLVLVCQIFLLLAGSESALIFQDFTERILCRITKISKERQN